jgi:hypothetical protein
VPFVLSEAAEQPARGAVLVASDLHFLMPINGLALKQVAAAVCG